MLLCDWGGAIWLAEDRDLCDRPGAARVRINDPEGVLAIPNLARSGVGQHTVEQAR